MLSILPARPTISRARSQLNLGQTPPRHAHHPRVDSAPPQTHRLRGRRVGPAAIREPGGTAHLTLHIQGARLAPSRGHYEARLPPTVARPPPYACIVAPRWRRRPQDRYG